VIVRKMNLACAQGHRWFAPNPQAWVGKVCGRTYETGRSHGCQETLYAQKDQRPG
jgi:hypothetical protein